MFNHTKVLFLMAMVALVTMVALAACGGVDQATEQATIDPTAAPTATPAPETPPTTVPTMEPDTATGDATIDTAELAETLGNLSYPGLQPNQPITLTGGTATYDDGGSGRPVVTLAENLIPVTDLDGDGALDAVALLRDESTGSGTFYFLSAVLDVVNNPMPTEALLIGDRIQLKSLATDGPTIVGQLIAPAENDPACCGTWLFDKSYALEDGRLVETNSEQISQISATNIFGNWTLVDLNAGQEPIVSEAPITLQISDGRVAGSAGCNTFTGTFTGADDPLNGLAIDDVATTMMSCEAPVMDQEALYLSRLAGATSWAYNAGRLALVYPVDDSEFGALLFEPATLPASPAATGELPPALVAQLDDFLNSQVWTEGEDPTLGAPGVVLLVQTPQGRYLKAVGVSSIEGGTPMQVDDRLEIGSNTKSFVTVLLTQLQEEGVLSWDDPLSQWLPDLAAEIPNGELVTLRQMAQHTTGIWDYGDPILADAATDPEKLEVEYTPEELVQYAIDNGTPNFAPGEGWKYSNTPYILLGMVAEEATGQTLDALLRERIFEPLGLESAVLIGGVPAEGDITTSGYWWLDTGERRNTTRWNASQGWAAGAIAMTAEDLATYAKALAAGDLFRSPDSLAEMVDFNPSSILEGLPGYGLGLIDFGNGNWGHEGQTAGFQSLWFINPERGTVVVGLTNSAAYSGFNFLDVDAILRAYEP